MGIPSNKEKMRTMNDGIIFQISDRKALGTLVHYGKFVRFYLPECGLLGCGVTLND
jgi:hypothetical protein